MRISRPFLAACSALLIYNASATIRYVDVNSPGPSLPYTTWATAATNIQDAAALSGSGDTILVTNGVYQFGGNSFNGSNRVNVPFGVNLQSVNGPAVTIIKGYQVPGTTNGSGAVRCVYLNQFSTLAGFTLTNGATQSSGSGPPGSGGGVLVNNADCVISNCIIAGNAAYYSGGGVFGNLFSPPVIRCVISGNTAQYGGGAYVSVLSDCVVSNNNAAYGGGLYNCAATNCLLVANGSTNNTSGGAADNCALNGCTVTGNFEFGLGAADTCTLNNCIVYYNTALTGWSDCYSSRLTNCCALSIETVGSPVNCLTNAPGFVDAAAGNYHLNPWSRCVDTGNSAMAAGSTDLDGNPRIAGAAVDMGCYENSSPLSGTIHYVSLSGTNPVVPYTDWPTAATNIQDAVAVAQPGEFVIADDGVYTNSSVVIYGVEANRVALTNGITLASAGGRQAATIAGGTQTRCVYVGSNSALIGFTLTNGNARDSGDITNEQSGGGAWCENGGVISNCWLTGNFTRAGNGMGAGVFGGAVFNCIITNNGSINNGLGGGAALANLYNCLVVSNATFWLPNYGGGLYRGTASNCTFIGNNAYVNGGGAAYSKLFNCALSGNVSSLGAGGVYQSMLSNCIVAGNQGAVGGAYQSTNYNCIFTGNSGRTANGGGGIYSGLACNCIFTNNGNTYYGGGASGATLYNCLLIGNVANSGGGAANCILNNCTVVGNLATNIGGGVFASSGSVNNSIVYYNHTIGGTDVNYFGAKFNFSCSSPTNNGIVTTNEPLFVNVANDFHLQSNSPCINAGKNSYATNTDLDGNPRIAGGTVDLGAYEFQSPSSIISYAFLQQHGLPTDGSADFQDTDGDGASNYAEWKSGTDPTDASSILALQSPVPASGDVAVTWQSVLGYYYYVQRTADLTQPFQTIATNIFGHAGTTSYTDTPPPNGAPYFYRVGVQ